MARSKLKAVWSFLTHQAPVAWVAIILSIGALYFAKLANDLSKAAYELSAQEADRSDTLMLKAAFKGNRLTVEPLDESMRLHVCHFHLPENIGLSYNLLPPSFDYDLAPLERDVSESFVKGWHAPSAELGSVPLIIETVYTVRGRIIHSWDLYGLHFTYQAQGDSVKIQWVDLVYTRTVDPKADHQKMIDDGWYNLYAQAPLRASLKLLMSRPKPEAYLGSYRKLAGSGSKDKDIGITVTKQGKRFLISLVTGNFSPKVELAHTPEIEAEAFYGSDGSLVFSFTDSFNNVGAGKLLCLNGVYFVQFSIFKTSGTSAKEYPGSMALEKVP